MKHDQDFARLIRWLKANGLEASTRSNDPLVIRKRTPRKSRLTGEAR